MASDAVARRLWLGLALGAASVLAFAPFGLFPLLLPTLGGLYALLGAQPDARRPARSGFFLGAAFGFGLFLAGVSWVYVSLSAFGGMPPPLAALSTLALCALLACWPGLAGAAFVRYRPALWWQRALFFAALWTSGEWLRGWVLTGFPWLALGYAQTPPSPLAGWAPLFGVYGVSFVLALVVALGCEAVRHVRQRAARAAVAAVLAALGLCLGGALLGQQQWTTPVGQPVSVALLQGNIPQALKWRPELFIDSLRTYYRLAQDNPAQLTVLPETAIPAFLDQLPGAYLDDLARLAARTQGDLLLGIAIGDNQRYANAALSIGASGQQQYHKVHLVPFGEFVPPGFKWFMGLLHIPLSDFTPGDPQQPPFTIGDLKVAANICYEDAFGEEIIRALPEAMLLVNLSNVAWFGDSLAPAQHLQIARMRSLENGRMMLRATNTGMTAIIDSHGNVVSALKPFTRGALRGEAQGFSGQTPYSRWGNWPVAILALSLITFFCRRNALFSRTR